MCVARPDGRIDWREFHYFLSNEVMAGKDPLGGEYVLPSGLSLPISSMIAAIRRRKMLDEVEKVREGARRVGERALVRRRRG